MPTSPLPGPLTVRPARVADRPAVEQLWQMFKHDMSEFVMNSLPGPDGRFKRDRLVAAFGAPDAEVLLLLAGERPAGLATVSGIGSARAHLGNFFVIRAIRGAGVGRWFARQVITRYPGPWEIAFQDANLAAARLWTGVAAELGGGTWSEEHRPVPGRPAAPPDHFVLFTCAPSPQVEHAR